MSAQILDADRACELADSHLVRMIGQQLTKSFRADGRMRTLFVPWYSPDEHQSERSMQTITKLLDVPLITLRSHHSMTYDARLLARLVQALCPLKQQLPPLQMLKQLSYSAQREDSILNYIAKYTAGKRIAIGSLGAGSEADSLVSHVLEWSRQIGLKVALVLAHRRPAGIVETISLPVGCLREDIYKLLPAPQPGTEEKNASKIRTAEEEEAPEQDAPFYERLVSNLRRRVPGSRIGGRQPVIKERQTDSSWVDLLARLSGSNWAAALAIATAWREKDELARERIKKVREDTRYLKLDNSEELDALDGRLRFLTMLHVLYPDAFETAAHEIDGADQLYRIHLILCGATAKDSLLSSNLLPAWRQRLADPLFCEIFYACFHNARGGQSLVERFESRSQLHRLLCWPPAASSEGSVNALQVLIDEHQAWLRMLAREDSLEEPTPADLKESAKRMEAESQHTASTLARLARRLFQTFPTASDALQAAQLLMSVCELLRDINFESRNEMYELIEELTDEAINQSGGAIRVDASLLRTRALALRGDADGALDSLPLVRRMSGDVLGRCATQIEEAFVYECGGEYMRAIQLYEEALGLAEDLGAAELVARASSGCLRCDAVANAVDQRPGIHMRARIILQIQSARAPELGPMSKRTKPTLFISYRAETRAITRAMIDVFKPEKSLLAVWADVKLTTDQDFNPTIHRRLHDADAIVLLLSPDYFRSPWCVHELHFALSQNEVRGVPLCWAWCQPFARSGASLSQQQCESLARSQIAKSFSDIDQDRRGYELGHVEERLRRLFARGRLLQKAPVVFTPIPGSISGSSTAEESEPKFDALGAQELCKPLLQMAPLLYRRARLPGCKTAERDNAV